jgi:hypothetical protein
LIRTDPISATGARDAWSHLKRQWKSGMSALPFVFGVLSLSGGASVASIVGDWYGEGYQPLWHENAQWLMHLEADGGYAIEFRQYHHCQVVLDQKEIGTWKLGDEFRTVTTALNGRPTRFENDYRVGALTDTEFDITHIGTGQAYVEKRVGAHFVMPKPDCPTS